MRLCAPPSPSAPRQQAAAQRSTNNACPLIFPSAPCNPPWGFPRLGETNVVPLTRPANLGLLLPPAPPPSRHTKTCSAHLPSPPLADAPCWGGQHAGGQEGAVQLLCSSVCPAFSRRPPAPTTRTRRHALLSFPVSSSASPLHVCARRDSPLPPPPPPAAPTPPHIRSAGGVFLSFRSAAAAVVPPCLPGGLFPSATLLCGPSALPVPCVLLSPRKTHLRPVCTTIISCVFAQQRGGLSVASLAQSQRLLTSCLFQGGSGGGQQPRRDRLPPPFPPSSSTTQCPVALPLTSNMYFCGTPCLLARQGSAQCTIASADARSRATFADWPRRCSRRRSTRRRRHRCRCCAAWMAPR